MSAWDRTNGQSVDCLKNSTAHKATHKGAGRRGGDKHAKYKILKATTWVPITHVKEA